MATKYQVDYRPTVTMSLQEFIERLGLPGRPVSVTVFWNDSNNAVVIPIESEAI